MSEWISCYEKLPEICDENNLAYLDEKSINSVYVLVWHKEGFASVAYYDFTEDRWFDFIDNDADYDCDEITHWQPLPGPPTNTRKSSKSKRITTYNTNFMRGYLIFQEYNKFSEKPYIRNIVDNDETVVHCLSFDHEPTWDEIVDGVKNFLGE